MEFLPRVALALVSIATVSTWPHRPFVFVLGLSFVFYGSVSFVVLGGDVGASVLNALASKAISAQGLAAGSSHSHPKEAGHSDLASNRPASSLQASHEALDLLLPLAPSHA